MHNDDRAAATSRFMVAGPARRHEDSKAGDPKAIVAANTFRQATHVVSPPAPVAYRTRGDQAPTFDQPADPWPGFMFMKPFE